MSEEDFQSHEADVQESVTSVNLGSEVSSIPIDSDSDDMQDFEHPVNSDEEQLESEEIPQEGDNEEEDRDEAQEHERKEQEEEEQEQEEQEEEHDQTQEHNQDPQIMINDTTASEINEDTYENGNQESADFEPSEISVDTPVNNSLNATRNSTSDATSTLRTRTRASSIISTASNNVKSTVHLAKTTLEKIQEEKDLKKYPNTQKSIERALTRLKESSQDPSSINVTSDSLLIFDTLRDCCRTESSRIQRTALDCLSKMFSFRALDESLLVNPPDSSASNDQTVEVDSGVTPPPKQNLIDAAIDTVADCFQGEGTNEKVELQIIRALSSCILVEDSISLCHGASLLKAIRTVYNIFVMSLSAANQGIAQATLSQMVSSVFDKIDLKKDNQSTYTKSAAKSLHSSSEVESIKGDTRTTEPVTLENMGNLNDDEEIIAEAQKFDSYTSSQDLVIKDAFLVFRTMAKICAKPLESNLDMRSQAVRSKLLSLHIIYSILKEHVDVFLSPDISLPGKKNETLLDSIRQYLCLSLSRNAASPISPVFEITLEILWLLIANLKVEFLREIPVFLTEIYFPIAELSTSTAQQKRYFLVILQRICNDPRTLIEFYLNYDCHPAMPNIMEQMIDHLTRSALTRVEITPSQRAYYDDQLSKPLATYNFDQLPLLTIQNLSSNTGLQVDLLFPVEFALKMTSLGCIVSVLRSLSAWAHKALNPQITQNRLNSNSNLTAEPTLSSINLNDDDNKSLNGQDIDDPMQFENLKQRKTQLSDCIAIFNHKPKKAIPLLVDKGFLEDDSPKSIAKWMLKTEGLDLAAVGDYLGEGDDKNIAIMHAFVDEFDFTGLSIVDALRDFLQTFRLPGEGQKIDRFMLKFAERFVEQNPEVFSKADTAYVLCYSLIMLNTDLHSSHIKNKMSLEEFLENNEGIDNGKDLPKEFLVGLFNEIANNEIKLLSEQHQAMLAEDDTVAVASQPQSAFNFFNSRDLQREAYIQVSKEIASKTELVFKNLSKTKLKTEGETYYAASHVEHVKSIFENLWMSFLAALTPPFKEYDDLDTTNKCLEGLKISIKIASIFAIDDARQSFIGALVQFCNLQNIEEIKIKNVNAMVDLLEVALSEGNFIKESWKDILLVVSQIERLQLISKGIDRNAVPDVSQARITNPRQSVDSTRTAAPYFFDIWSKKATPMELALEKHQNQSLSPDMTKYISSSELVVLMDNIFTKSGELSANAIVDFIKALTNVSLEEIESSQHTSTPRMFSLQKMIDVCYYNMDRIKLEWTPIWAVMGSAFNKIATNPNLAVVFFAIDSLRQLSVRFLDIEELNGFEFQHDFLKPFEYTVQNTGNIEVQEMIIECFRNFILLKSEKIKSGWKPILESLQYTAQSNNEVIVSKTQNLVSEDIIKNNFESVFIQEDSFSELVNVFKEITKNKKYQKNALHALETLRIITKRIATISCYDNESSVANEHYQLLLRGKDIFQDVWFPILFCFHETIMTADDLEVRSRSLNYMFDSLVAYGNNFDIQFWSKICEKLLFPIFDVLSRHWEVNQFNSHDDLSVWLSTTLIQALRNLVALFTHYFESLNGMLDGFLKLLVSCICQENDTIARIGRACLQQLILQNVNKFENNHWCQIGDIFVKLFDLTTAIELFEYDPMHQGRRKSTSFDPKTSNVPKLPNDDENISETLDRAAKEEDSEDFGSNENETKPINIKNTIVVKCILQLLMIELVSDLFDDEQFEQNIPYVESIKLTQLLQKSYEFAHDFNNDIGLRTRLVEAHVVNTIPSLLKQETSAAAVLIDLMFKLYLNDDDKKHDLGERLIKVCVSVVKSYILLDGRTMERSIVAWRPVIVEILQGYYEFDDEDFKEYCSVMYGLVIRILDKSVPTDLRMAIKQFLGRVGEVYLQISPDDEE